MDRILSLIWTKYRAINNKFMTWANNGPKTVNCNIKHRIIVLAIIFKSNKKLLLVILGKKKTKVFAKRFPER